MQSGFRMGQYVYGNSWFHTGRPISKIIFASGLSFCIFSAQNLWEFLVLGGYIVSLAIFIGFGGEEFKKILKFSKIFIYFSLFAGLFTYSNSYIFEYFIFKLSKDGLLLSFQSSVRVILIIILSLLITRTTSTVAFLKIFDFFKGFGKNKVFQKIGDLGLVTILSLRFVPLIFEEAQRIKIAQTSRGVDFETRNLKKLLENYSSFLGQLMVSTIKRGETITLAILSKGYGVPREKPEKLNFYITKSDGLILMHLILLFVLNQYFLRKFNS